MALQVNPVTGVILVPQADLTPLGGDLYEHDMPTFHLNLRDWEETEAARPYRITHDRPDPITISGVLYPGGLVIQPPYQVQYEAGAYRVNLVGLNNNVSDVLINTGVTVIPNNSAGLQRVDSEAVPVKGQPWLNFQFVLFDANDHVTPLPGKSPRVRIKKDGAPMVVADNSPAVHSEEGIYEIDLTGNDMDFDTGTLYVDVADQTADRFILSLRTSLQ